MIPGGGGAEWGRRSGDWAAACLLAAFALAAGCVASPPGAIPQRDGGVRALTVLATNDFHGAFDEVPLGGGLASGGAPALAEAVEAVRAEVGRERVLLLDGGDLFQGSALVNQTRGLAMVELYGRLGYDAVAVGNHEFDYGGAGPAGDALLGVAALSPFPFLTANVSRDGAAFAGPGLQPSALLERGGIRIGVLGLTTAETPSATHPRNVRGLTFGPVEEAAGKEVARLRARGAEVVIALAHVSGTCREIAPGAEGPPETCTLDPSSELARVLALPRGPDVVVAGHDHTWIAHRMGGAAVLEQGAMGAALGRIDLAIGAEGVDWGRTRIRAPASLRHAARQAPCEERQDAPEAETVAAAAWDGGGVEAWLAARQRELSLAPCHREGCLASPAEASREGQGAAGALVARAMLRALPGDVALQNGGGVRAPLPTGTVFFRDLYRTLPFDNRVVRLELDGARLLEVLRIGTSGGIGMFQVAGASLTVDPHRKGGRDVDGDGSISAWERDRLCDVRIGGEPLDPRRTYRVVVNDFMADGGDHLNPLKDLPREEGPDLRDAVRGLLREAGEACVDPAEAWPHTAVRLGTCP